MVSKTVLYVWVCSIDSVWSESYSLTWYICSVISFRMLPLMPSWNPFTQRFQFNWFGLRLTKYSLKVMEFLRLAPAGTSRTQILLQSGGMGLAKGGELGIFTPMYLMVGQVPLDKE